MLGILYFYKEKNSITNFILKNKKIKNIMIKYKSKNLSQIFFLKLAVAVKQCLKKHNFILKQ